MLSTDMLSGNTITAATVVLALLTLRMGWAFYRRTVVKIPIRNLPGPARTSWRRGNLGELYSPAGMSWHHQLPRQFGGLVKIHALFGDENVYVTDPLALNQVCVKDQDIFEQTTTFVQGNGVIFGDGLLSTTGAHHRNQRRIINPVFGTSHMRDITPAIYEVVHKLTDLLKKRTQNGASRQDMLDLMMRTALEGIGQGGLGHSFNALEDDDGRNEFRDALRGLIPAIFSLAIERQFLPYILKIGTPSFRGWLVNITPSRRLHRLRDIVNTMYKVNSAVFESKKEAIKRGDEKVLDQVGHGRDIVSILMRGMESAESDEDKLSDSEVLAQLTTLVFTSHDTTSSTLAHILHLLCTHQDIQTRLRNEIRRAKDEWEKEHGNRDLGYDLLSELPYLEAVCRETLRLHAAVTFMTRTARAPAVLPLLWPVMGTDGKMITEVPIAENQNIHIGIGAANRDPRIWGPDADEWKPERWENGVPKLAMDAHLPSIYAGTMSFLGGGRACIGMKFAQLEMKVILSMLLDEFKVSLSKDEVTWKLANIQMPWVKGFDKGPSMPLMVERV
ncbi:cytochrome P450 [Favolaschia claudopus]|uniref:Cytochrome P450 n=1 Tax=Favolaschia claudopus TaxID=2862362 RepID=A0AAW0DZX2_9AGAR